MSSIPPDMHAKVHELALAMTNAAMAEDDFAFSQQYESLRDYCDEQVKSGRAHPFLFETLGDFTEDPAKSLDLYREALRLSIAMGEPLHTLLVAMGETLREMGQSEQAEAHLRDGKAKAMARNDLETVEYADQLLKAMGC